MRPLSGLLIDSGVLLLESVMLVGYLLQSLVLELFVLLDSFPVMLALSALFGISNGLRITLLMPSLTKHFGVDRMPLVLGGVGFWIGVTLITGPFLVVGHKMYDWSESTTQSSDWEDGATPFGRGNVTGYVFRDAHELGDVSLGNLQFVNGIGFHGVPSFVDKPFDGVFGLRLGANSTLYEMAKLGVIGSPRVGLYFSTDVTAPGEALFGGANEQHYQGSMTFVEALDSAFQVHLNG
ncbi:hypothetical protein HPB51_026736 [Rhipicephalus microplus]|uniref:Peptidase A1 domain-containing protein n=1 Tax=Rhipicephalus microplus TaxID=6941 RepID=A0A9J6D2B8_RHIMP|nr:hypothetical protein HPB51_026736 [Rhipicephalus microplus]